MSEIQLFSLAARQARWLSARESTVAANVANANVPSYRAVDVAPFDQVLDRTSLGLHMTSATHGGAAGADPVRNDEPQFQISSTGKSVSFEQELIKADEVNRAYALNTNVVKAFHRMLMMSLK